MAARGQRGHRVTGGWQATMLGCVHSRKLSAAIVAAAIMLVGAVNCYAQTGTIHLTYRLSVSSFGSGTIGVSGGELVGTAHNLRTAADIAGTYKAAAAGLTVGAGGQVARFQNENGVILELVGAQLGLPVSLGSAGMTIALQAQ